MGHSEHQRHNHVELVDVWNAWDGPTEGICRIDGHLYFFVCASDVLQDEERRFAYYDMPLDKLIEAKYDLMGVLSGMKPDGYFVEDELQRKVVT